MEWFVVSRFFLNTSINHSFKSKFTTSLNHSNHQDTLVKIFLFRNFCSRFLLWFEWKLTCSFTPGQKISIFVSPVFHHCWWEFTRNDVVHVLLIKWSKQSFDFFRKSVGLDFCRVWKTVHHTCNTTEFQSFTNYVPAVHKEFCNPFRIHTVSNHLVVTADCTSLEHTTKNCLFTHKVRLNFCNERRFKNTSLWTAHTYSQSLSHCPTLSFRVVYRMNSDKIRYTKSTGKFVVNFCTRTFWSTHNNCDVLTNLHSFFNHVKSMWVPQSCTLFHQLLNFVYNWSVLLIWSKVTNKVSSWNHFLICTNFKSVFCSVLPGLTFFCDSRFAECIRNIKTRVTKTHTLVQTLSTTTNDYDFKTFKSLYAISKFFFCHRTTVTKLQTSFTPWNWVKIVDSHFSFLFAAVDFIKTTFFRFRAHVFVCSASLHKRKHRAIQGSGFRLHCCATRLRAPFLSLARCCLNYSLIGILRKVKQSHFNDDFYARYIFCIRQWHHQNSWKLFLVESLTTMDFLSILYPFLLWWIII